MNKVDLLKLPETENLIRSTEILFYMIIII